jgi:transglutaminase-like putative cysteine protease
MDSADILAFAIFFTLCILFGGFLAVLEFRRRRRKDMKKRPARKLLLLRRIHRRFVLMFRSRLAMKREMWWSFVDGEEEIEVVFYVPRKPAQVNLSVKGTSGFCIDRYRYESNGQWITGSFGVKYTERKWHTVARIYPSRITLTKKIRFRVLAVEGGRKCLVQTRLIKEPYPDLEQWNLAAELHDKKEYQQALEHFKECCKYSDESPWVYEGLSAIYALLGMPEAAREHAINMALAGFPEKGVDRYSQIQLSNPWLDTEGIVDLQRSGAEWQAKHPRGAVVLRREQKYWLGFPLWYLRTCREVIEIRRPVAARKMNRLYFPLHSSDWLLFSNLRIIHSKDEIEEVASEHFTKGSGSDGGGEDQFGTWILPDLVAGDLIEWSYHVLYREDVRINNLPHFFISAFPQSEYSPTFEGTLQFKAPKDWNLKLVGRNKAPLDEESFSEDGRWQLHTFRIKRYVPILGSGFYYETHHLNPSVACASGTHTWEDAVKSGLAYNFGELDIEDQIPEPLVEVLDKSATPEEALEQAFYWIRDRLKYRPFDRHEVEKAHRGWAKEIVDSGVANCRDKSYLLCQICKKLGIRAEVVAFPAVRGLVYEDLPANQFDHAFVRAFVYGDWRYPDASYQGASFFSNPTGFQGLGAVILDGKGTAITIPEDNPDINRITALEIFNDLDGNRLAGSFALRAEGCLGRLLDDNWKRRSLQSRGRRHAAEEALRMYMPDVFVKDYTRSRNTSNSNVLEAAGHHRRCQLSLLGDRLVGTIRWDDLAVISRQWETHYPEKMYAFQAPVVLEVNLAITGMLHGMLDAITQKVEMENDFCKITGERSNNENRIDLKRRIVIKHKFVTGNDLRLVPETLQRMEQALQVAVSLREDPTESNHGGQKGTAVG